MKNRQPNDKKATNPKDRVGSTKLPLDLVPDTIEVYAALAFTEGALKYGAHNWRIAGVRFSIYYAAMKRHMKKLWNGEWEDPKTGVPHLASIIACAGILADASLAGKLTDDRPPSVNLAALIDSADGDVARLKALFAEHNPRHWTIKDSRRG